jgi:hypothetical protein
MRELPLFNRIPQPFTPFTSQKLKTQPTDCPTQNPKQANTEPPIATPYAPSHHNPNIPDNILIIHDNGTPPNTNLHTTRFSPNPKISWKTLSSRGNNSSSSYVLLATSAAHLYLVTTSGEVKSSSFSSFTSSSDIAKRALGALSQ